MHLLKTLCETAIYVLLLLMLKWRSYPMSAEGTNISSKVFHEIESTFLFNLTRNILPDSNEGVLVYGCNFSLFISLFAYGPKFFNGPHLRHFGNIFIPSDKINTHVIKPSY